MLVRPLEAADHERWLELYRGYTTFYEVDHTDAMTAQVWDWLTGPERELEGWVVQDDVGRVVGIAHLREFVRPLSAARAGFLDDLFVEPAARGTGAVDALLARLRELAADRGWTTVRWITSETNYRARAVYDRHAVRTPYLSYEMPPAPRTDRTGDP